MLKPIFSLLFWMIIACKDANSLTCQSGYEIQSDIFSKKKWALSNCSSNEGYQCIREEGVIVVFDVYEINIVIGGCERPNSCIANCMSRERSSLINAFSDAARLNQSVLTYRTRYCRIACCQVDYCNQQNISSILSMNEAAVHKEDIQSFSTLQTIPTSASSTEQTTDFDDAFTCLVGFEIESLISATRDFNHITTCRRSLHQKCIRVEGVVVLHEYIELNFVSAFCDDTNACQKSCRSIVSEIMRSGRTYLAYVDYDLRNCIYACCESSQCNRHDAAEIKRAVIESDTNASIAPVVQPANSTENRSDDVFECLVGYAVTTNFSDSFSSWRTEFCQRSRNERCVHREGTARVEIDAFFLDLNITSAICSNESTSEGTCTELLTQPLAQQLLLEMATQEVIYCFQNSCDTSYCNNDSVSRFDANILQYQNEPTATSMPRTTTTESIINRPPILGDIPFDSLYCTTGFEITSTIVNDSSWNLMGCQSGSDQSCLRTEITAMDTDQRFNVTLSIATCLDRLLCQTSCENLARSLMSVSNSEITNRRTGNNSLNLMDLNLLTCDYICCNGSNCNNIPIERIREQNNRTASLPAVLPSLSTDENILECFSGYRASSPTFNFSSWISTQCSPSQKQACLRAEATLTDNNEMEVHAVLGFCADQLECDNRVCSDFIGYIRSGSEDVRENQFVFSNVFVSECISTCCYGNNCNNFTIDEIERQEGSIDSEKSATSSLCSEGICSLGKEEDALFLLSLVPRLDKLPPQTASEVKMRFLAIIHQAQFGEMTIR